MCFHTLHDSCFFPDETYSAINELVFTGLIAGIYTLHTVHSSVVDVCAP